MHNNSDFPYHLRINPPRLKADFDSLAAIGADGQGGVHRPALGEAHLAARAWFREQVRAVGFELRVDGAGNHSAFLECSNRSSPILLLGSHLDSVPHGGRFDGALGLLSALEVLRTIQEAGLRLPLNLEAIDFTDEEGTLVGLLGSTALVGHLSRRDLQNPRGGRHNLLAGLKRAGMSETGLLDAGRDPASLAGYLEVHIEQGPRLERAGVQIGVVTGIVGIASYRLTFTGRADHAGTTPMPDRLDAALGASAFILAVRQTVLEEFPDCVGAAVANIGQIHIEPGAFNIVPHKAILALEFRAADQVTFDRLETTLLKCANSEAQRFGLQLEIEFLGKHFPTPMSPLVQQAIRQAAEGLGLSTLSLPSGAGHDAQSLAPLCPAGMIFVPSVDGASHSAREYTRWEDCVNGANVLLQTAMIMALGTHNINELEQVLGK